MPQLAVRLAVAALFLLPAPGPARADDPPPWDAAAFSAEPAALLAAAAALPVEEGDDVRLLLRQRDHRFDAEGRGTVRQHFLVYLLTQDGVDAWSTWSESWSPWHQDRPQLRARVITAEHAEHALDPATVIESPVGASSDDVLSDRLRLRAPLPGVAVGAVVEVETVVRDTAPSFPHGTAHRFLFGLRLPTERTRLVLEAPEEMQLVWTSRLLPDLEPRRTVAGGRVRLVFESGPREVVETEPLTPGDVPVWPLVGYATGTSWSDVARRYGEIVDRQIGDSDLSQIVAAATEGAETREEKVARLLAWLHREIRYTGLEFAEAAIVPRSPAETIERTYGDCKDKATLLVALLRQSGIAAYLAILNTGPGQDVEPELPGLGIFDHAIVHLPELDLWIDATDPFAAVGELPPGDQGRLALVTSPGTSELRRTPEARSEDNRNVETREIFLAADLGGARVVETTEAWGAIGNGLRRDYSRLEPNELEDRLTDYMESTYASQELVDLETSDPHDLAGPLRIRLEATGARTALTDLAEAAVVIRTIYLLQRLPEPFWEREDEEGEDEKDEEDEEDEHQGVEIGAAGRRTAAELQVPFVNEWRYRIVPPPGYRPIELLESVERALGPASLTRDVRITEEGVVEIDLRFDTGQRRFDPAEFEALREGVLELVDEDHLLLELEHVGEAHLAVGEIREALAELGRRVAADPDRGLPHARRARALLEAGLGEAARREAERAVELQPEFAIVHQIRGLVLEHDLLGRELRGGFDRQGAIAAMRQARELDPDNAITRQNLAVLLEHDDQGFRYTAEADLEAAIAEYRSVREELENPSVDESLAIALARAGRFDEMLELVEEIETPNTDVLRLVALAKAKSPSAAVREARQIGDDAQSSKVLAAAQTLMQLRDYAESAALFTAAARGGANATAILDLAEQMRKTRPWQELEMDAGEPRGVVEKFMAAFFQGSPEDLLALSSRHIRAEDPAEDLEEYHRASRVLREGLRPSGVPVDVVLDLALSAMTTSLDGEPELGYRVRVRWRLGQDVQEERLYLIPEDGEYRLVGTSETLAGLGGEALRRLAAGDVAAARRWLDWARDGVAAARADDPWSGHPLSRFWTRGDEGDEARIRAAAASLAAAGEHPRKVLKILRKGRQSAPSEDWRRGFELAQVAAYSELEEPAKIVPLARGWLAEQPASETAFETLREALGELERWDELKQAADERLALRADDPAAVGALAAVALAGGDLAVAEDLLRRRIDLGDAAARDHERLAWLDVVRGTVDEETLESAQQAAALAEDEDSWVLQTLAVVYAELGRSAEARQVLFQKLALDGVDSPRSEEWFVLGRIAESYGVLDAARDAYAKVEPPEEGLAALSAHRLAERRLAALR